MKKILTVTVGIPAHNEEANIGQLLQSIVLQKGNFILEKIIVVCDGCTDGTESIVREFAQTHSVTQIVSDGKRTGKAKRLNQLYQMNESDFLITLDADVIPKDETTFEELLVPFEDQNIAVVAGNDRPLPGRTFVENIIIARDAWWYEARKDFNGGNNRYNSAGRCFTFRKDFTKRFVFLPGTLHDEEVIYMQTIQQSKKFAFAVKAIVYYREAATWKELVDRAKRFEHKDDLAGYGFTFDVWTVPRLPLGRKLVAIVYIARLRPVLILCSLFLTVVLKMLLLSNRGKNIHFLGLWQTTESTKQLF